MKRIAMTRGSLLVITVGLLGCGSALQAQYRIDTVASGLNAPFDVAIDPAGSLYIAEWGGNQIRRLAIQTGVLSAVGRASARSVLFDGAGNLYVTGVGGVVRMSLANGASAPVLARANFLMGGLALDPDGTLYFGGANLPVIFALEPGGTSAPLSLPPVIAGRLQSSASLGFYGDGGPATNAGLNTPLGLALDRKGNLYIADAGNNAVRRLDLKAGTITTVAGTGVPGLAGDGGRATAAQLMDPRGVAFDFEGNLWIADSFNHSIRKVDPAGIIRTVAGTGVAGFSGDGGPAESGQLNSPSGIAVDAAGIVYVADTNNGRIRRLSPSQVPPERLIPSQEEISLVYRMGTEAPVLPPLAIQSSGAPLRFTVSGAPEWLAATSSGDSTPAVVTLDVRTANLTTGRYRATIAVSSQGAPTASIRIELTVVPADTRLVVRDTTELSFSRSGSQTIVVESTGAPVDFTVRPSGGPWLSVSTLTATTDTPQRITVSANASLLGAGTYRGAIGIQARGALNTLTIPVTLIVTAPPVSFSAGTPVQPRPPATPHVFTNPFSIAAGDFDGDGQADLLVSQSNGVLSLIPRTGDGGFGPPRNLPGRYFDYFGAPQVHDFNGDGRADVAVWTELFQGVILSGRSDGGFDEKRSGFGWYPLSFADFNRDGKIDVASFDYGEEFPYKGLVTIHLGRGDGSFAPAFNRPIPISEAAGVIDANGDGWPDLWVNSYSDGFGLLPGKGDGTFGDPVSIGFPAAPYEAADFNGDGHADIVWISEGRLYVAFGDGRGGFSEPVRQELSGFAVAAFARDLDGDGRPDLVVAETGGVTILHNDRTGALQRGVTVTPHKQATIAFADFDGDGKLDLAALSQVTGGVLVMRSEGTTIAKLGPAGRIAWVAVADFNGDGAADVAALDVARDVIVSFAADGRGTVSESTAHFSANSTVAVADFNGDGRPDLAVADPDRSAVVVLSGEAATRSLPRARHGNGRFRETFEAPAGGGSVALAVADFNFDGRPDIAMLAGVGRLTVLINEGQGFRASATEVGPSSRFAPSLVAADFDGDGRIDLAAGGDLNPFLLLGNGDGSFRVMPPLGFLSGNLAVGDFNNDGRSDLAVLSSGQSTMLTGPEESFAGSIALAFSAGPASLRSGQPSAI